jgi:hypothetical protein
MMATTATTAARGSFAASETLNTTLLRNDRTLSNLPQPQASTARITTPRIASYRIQRGHQSQSHLTPRMIYDTQYDFNLDLYHFAMKLSPKRTNQETTDT